MSSEPSSIVCADCGDAAHLVWTEALTHPRGGTWLCVNVSECVDRVEARIYRRLALSAGDWTLADVAGEMRSRLSRRT